MNYDYVCAYCGEDVFDGEIEWGGKIFCSDCCKILFKEQALGGYND